ncbi:MAG: histidine kinase dimerization/phospho-acceptor domain-containing protein, partial [Cyanobacteria bacterium P01_H01_bin.15]
MTRHSRSDKNLLVIYIKVKQMPWGRSSFRRILLSRLLLISVPVLLMGVYVTHRKARSAFLESARQNLTESAIRKMQSIEQANASLRANLITASDAIQLKLESPTEQQNFIEQWSQQLPSKLLCVQLLNLNTQTLNASTCGKQPLRQERPPNWDLRQTTLLSDPNQIYVELSDAREWDLENQQLILQLSAPVYDLNGQLRYALIIQSALLQRERLAPGSLEGYPMVINENRTILAHPYPTRIGQNLADLPHTKRLQSIVRSALSGRQDFLHFLSFSEGGEELLAGYTALPSPITEEQGQQWVVVAFSPLDDVFYLLSGIRNLLVSVMAALILASLVTTLLIARDLARPLEKLRDYALGTHHLQSLDPIPYEFRIREFHQLGKALNKMVKQLRNRGDEILTAWEEAHRANQLKTEFLATTSHELRTPLNGIIGCLSIVNDDLCDSDEEVQEYLGQAYDAAIHLLGIINDVLDISKIEAGKLQLKIKPFELQPLLREVIELQVATIEQQGLQWIQNTQTTDLWVQGDRGKFKQVLLNILGNAIKF